MAARPDPEWGEAVTAFVVARAPTTATELRDWCRERLAAHKVPKRIELVTGLPRNPAGKLLRDRLPADHPNRATMEDHNGERWTCWFAGSSDGLGRSPRLGSPLASSPA